MSKQASFANKRNTQETRRLDSDLSSYNERLMPGLYGAQQRAGQLYGDISSGYRNFLNRPKTPFSSSAMPYYQEFARTGGINDENRSRIRGGGVFDEFARTGGLSEADKGNIRAQGTAAIPGFFDSLSAELGRANEATGGTNPGYNSQMSMLARDRSRGAADAALNAELGIMGQVNEGRRWGANSMSGAENALVDATQRGRLAGINGIGDLDKFGADYGLRQEGMDLSALSGLGNLYSSRPGEVGMYEDLLANALFGGAQARRGLIQDYMQYNPNRSWAERNAPWIQAGSALLGSALTGGFGGGDGMSAANLRSQPYSPQTNWDMFRTMPIFG